jgi:SAM-dependent methyltransferase
MEIVNVEQAAAWDGHEGDVWTEHADRYDTAARRVHDRIRALTAIARSDDVVDVGCGTGLATREAARAAADGTVLGLDLSRRMLELARARSDADGLTNVTFIRGDAQVHSFEAASRDLAMSSFCAMFFGDPVAALANVGTALRPGGRLALATWRSLAENEWLVTLRTALAAGRELGAPPNRGPSPFGLSEPDHIREVVGAAGYRAIELTPVDEAMVVGKDAADALGFATTMGIYEGLTQDLDDATTAQVTDRLHDAFRAAETAEGVLLPAAAWFISATKG